jgi:hypothetical protein
MMTIDRGETPNPLAETIAIPRGRPGQGRLVQQALARLTSSRRTNDERIANQGRSARESCLAGREARLTRIDD